MLQCVSMWLKNVLRVACGGCCYNSIPGLYEFLFCIDPFLVLFNRITRSKNGICPSFSFSMVNVIPSFVSLVLCSNLSM